ncbi:Mpv17 / PMP22 family [Nesidiocoris tenuis]|uniref:Mpv17 / PMP22 family n=1 Tax=Nesidiocoris tenuis TaxID=355587 RepID=A0ABN7BF10_9HEMI|nr:Mpv17 / PMP22 family [Nesidiocoris tenuis]
MLFVARAAYIFGKVKQVNRTIFSDKYLFLTNAIISASLSGVGDAIEQKCQVLKDKDKKEEEFDYVRSRNMCISGVIVGLFGHQWYRWLDGKYPGRTARVVTYKVLMDTLVFSPSQILFFFTTMGLLERSSPKKVGEEIIEKGKVLYLFEWMIWAPLQVVNFYFLSPKYRILFDNSLSLVYDVFVSYVKFDRTPDDKRIDGS